MPSTRTARVCLAGLSLWVLLLIVGTAYKSAVSGLDADVIMNSVMSLQKVTLFYWGQNRLLNVLPAATWLFRHPDSNLLAVLLLTSASFYGALIMLARLAARAFSLPVLQRYALIAAMTSSASVFLVGPAVSGLAIGHIEYPLPLLLLLVAFNWLATAQPSRLAIAGAGLLVFVAGGVNPAACLIMLMIAAARFCWNRRVEWASIGIGAMTIFTLAAWGYISRRMSTGMNYGLAESIDLGRIATAMQELLRGELATIDFPAVMTALGLAGIATMARQLFFGSTPATQPQLVRFAIGTLLAFCALWTLTLSLNDWVRLNGYHWRYGSYILFAGLFAWGLWLAQWDWAKMRLVGIAGLVLIMGVAAQRESVFHIHKPNTRTLAPFRALPQGMDTSVRFYAGTYWQVWPAVFLQMERGQFAFGLSDRSEVMQDEIRAYVGSLKAGDTLQVYCLNADVPRCRGQVSRLMERVRYTGTEADTGGTVRLQYEVLQGGISYAGTDFLALPSSVGQSVNGVRQGDGRSGYLFFGPFAHVERGRYRLTLTGSTGRVTGARVEVAAKRGKKVFAAAALPAFTTGKLVDGLEVELPSDLRDLEVRVIVTADDDIKASGFELIQEHP